MLEDTKNSPARVLAENRDMVIGDVQRWITDLACKDLKEQPHLLVPSLLGLIALRLGQLVNNQVVGAQYYRITPFTLGLEGQKIVEKQTDGLVRTVMLFIDKGSGGPTPAIRVGTQKVNMAAGQYGSGGVALDAGRAHELGNIRPETEMWGACNVAAGLPAFVIEFA